MIAFKTLSPKTRSILSSFFETLKDSKLAKAQDSISNFKNVMVITHKTFRSFSQGEIYLATFYGLPEVMAVLKAFRDIPERSRAFEIYKIVIYPNNQTKGVELALFFTRTFEQEQDAGEQASLEG